MQSKSVQLMSESDGQLRAFAWPVGGARQMRSCSSRLMPEQSNEWAVSRRYFSLESLAKLADTPNGQLAL